MMMMMMMAHHQAHKNAGVGGDISREQRMMMSLKGRRSQSPQGMERPMGGMGGMDMTSGMGGMDAQGAMPLR